MDFLSLFTGFVIGIVFVSILVLFKNKAGNNVNIYYLSESVVNSNLSLSHFKIITEAFSAKQLLCLKKHIQKSQAIYADKLYELDDPSFIEHRVKVIQSYIDSIDLNLSNKK